MLTANQSKFLRSHAHHLSPVLWVGANGITESLIAELNQTLDTHELIKVKLLHDDRELRAQLIQALCQASQADKVQVIGKVVVLFRRNSKAPKLSLPK
jgi:RNA-binding protein